MKIKVVRQGEESFVLACSRQCKCNKSGHFPQITEPEMLAKAIIETAREVKGS